MRISALAFVASSSIRAPASDITTSLHMAVDYDYDYNYDYFAVDSDDDAIAATTAATTTTAVMDAIQEQFNNPMTVEESTGKIFIEETPTTIPSALKASFPTALTNADLVGRVASALSQHGYTPESTLLATSFCCDEANRELEREFGHFYGDHFSMGGLAGFAFGGVTSFAAMAHHIPETGGQSCLIVYGPHVGVSSENVVGDIDRRGRRRPGACCGSAAAAAAYVQEIHRNGDGAVVDDAAAAADCLDMQQHFVGKMLLPHAARLDKAPNAAVELPFALYDEQETLMKKIVAAACGEVVGKIALLGGIQINTPGDCPDHFMPLSFELLDNKGTVTENLMSSLRQSDGLRPWIMELAN